MHSIFFDHSFPPPSFALFALSCLLLICTGPTSGADETASDLVGSFGGSCPGSFVAQQLVDPLPEECDRLIATGSGAAAAVLRPLNMSTSRDINFTLVVCVKNVEHTGEHALLHVIPAEEYDRSARSLNPVPLQSGATAIVWSDVPFGSHVAFIELSRAPSPLGRDSMKVATRRSKPCMFAREDGMSQAANPRDTTPNKEENGVRQGVPQDGNHDPSTQEWPIFEHLQRQQRISDGENVSLDRVFCGISGWQPVSVHRAIASFLRSEWYKVCSDACAHIFVSSLCLSRPFAARIERSFCPGKVFPRVQAGLLTQTNSTDAAGRAPRLARRRAHAKPCHETRLKLRT